jgi:hypothetical protein
VLNSATSETVIDWHSNSLANKSVLNVCVVRSHVRLVEAFVALGMYG